MQVNEVVVNGVTELSLVNDTVSEDTLLENVTAHDASGKQITGKVVTVPVDSELNAESENAIQNKAVAEALTKKLDKNPTSFQTQNSKVILSDNNEGGNLRLTSPDGTLYMEQDCYNNTLYRCYVVKDETLKYVWAYDSVNNLITFYPDIAPMTLTGNLTFKTANYSSNAFKVTDSGTPYGQLVQVGADGDTIVGAGESVKNLPTAANITGASENLHLCADGSVYVYSNCNTIANRKTFAFGTDGNLYVDGKKVLTASEGGVTIYTGALTQATGTYTITLGVKPKFVLCYSDDEADSLRKWWAKSVSGGHGNITITSTGFQYAQVTGQYFSQYFIALA